MTTDKELAEHMRKAAEHMEAAGRKTIADAWRREAEKFDPPAPTYPDGTIAWVTYKNYENRDIRAVETFRSGGWFAYELGGVPEYNHTTEPIKVEPLRVLADDEIALPRAAFGDACQSEARKYSRGLDEQSGFGHDGSARVWVAYARALDAEAGGQS